jgi:hypothetical protein
MKLYEIKTNNLDWLGYHEGEIIAPEIRSSPIHEFFNKINEVHPEWFEERVRPPEKSLLWKI